MVLCTLLLLGSAAKLACVAFKFALNLLYITFTNACAYGLFNAVASFF
jgi:hypothetical protein